jgi:hypothetical protein
MLDINTHELISDSMIDALASWDLGAPALPSSDGSCARRKSKEQMMEEFVASEYKAPHSNAHCDTTGAGPISVVECPYESPPQSANECCGDGKGSAGVSNDYEPVLNTGINAAAMAEAQRVVAQARESRGTPKMPKKVVPPLFEPTMDGNVDSNKHRHTVEALPSHDSNAKGQDLHNNNNNNNNNNSNCFVLTFIFLHNQPYHKHRGRNANDWHYNIRLSI